jgi:carbonic anhydrase/acetyltransferase-like protein (isoleucine patch superfamily)
MNELTTFRFSQLNCFYYNLIFNLKMFFKGALYYKLENATVGLAPKIRKMGRDMFNKGMEMQGPMAHKDTLVPSLRCVPISNSKYPKSLDADWVAPNAVLIGDIEMGEGSSVWHGVTLRGDQSSIKIGKNSLIQDNSRIASKDGVDVVIGDNVYVGANAKIDGCELESFSYVGMGATVGKGSVVESFAVVAAGAQVPENTTVPSG